MSPSFARHDLFIYQGDTFHERLTLPGTFDLAAPDIVLSATLRRYRDRLSELYAVFDVTVHDAPSRAVDVVLTPADTADIPRSGYWDIQAATIDGSWVRTLFGGRVTVAKEITTGRAATVEGNFILTTTGLYIFDHTGARVRA